MHKYWMDLRRTLLATLVLGLALGSALASSLAAREGNLFTSTLLAATALLLALVISFTIVPRLYRRAFGHRRTSVIINRAGYFYLGTLLVVGFAAFNTGNNLIYLILSAGLSLLAISEIFSTLNLGHIDLQIFLPDCVNAKEDLVAEIQATNLKFWLPCFSLEITGVIQAISPVRTTYSSAPPNRFLLGYLPILSGKETARRKARLSFPHRGLFEIGRLEICTRFPFGFVTKKKKAFVTGHITVLPESQPLGQLLEEYSIVGTALESLTRGWGLDLHSIRPYTLTDDARFLDWKASAKAGDLLLREFTREDERKCCLIFDNTVAGAEVCSHVVFERTVTLCANVARFLQSTRCEIRLLTSENSTRFGCSTSDLLDILKLLACIQPHSSAALDWEQLERERCLRLIFRGGSSNPPFEVWREAQRFSVEPIDVL